MKNWLALLTLAALTLPALAQPPVPARPPQPAESVRPISPPPPRHYHEVILANRTFYIVSCSEKDLLVRCPSIAAAQLVARRHQRETGHRPGIEKE